MANSLHGRSARRRPGRFRDAQVVEARHISPCRFVDLTVDPDRRIRDVRNIDRPAVVVTRVEMQAPIARPGQYRAGNPLARAPAPNARTCCRLAISVENGPVVAGAVDSHGTDRARDLKAGTNHFTGRVGVVRRDPTAVDHRGGRKATEADTDKTTVSTPPAARWR